MKQLTDYTGRTASDVLDLVGLEIETAVVQEIVCRRPRSWLAA